VEQVALAIFPRWSLATWNIVVDVILAIGVNGEIGAIVMCIAVVVSECGYAISPRGLHLDVHLVKP